MLSFERREIILDILRQKQVATVEELSKQSYSSGATVRRELAVLEADGLIMRIRGGATILNGNNNDAPLLFRAKVNIDKKIHIAKIARQFFKKGATMFWDSSSTVCCLANMIEEKSGITVITNSIPALTALGTVNGLDIISTGGHVFHNSALVGDIAVRNIDNYFADYLFFSCCSISENGHISEASEINATVKKAMLANAKIKILLCDSTKFGDKHFCKTCTCKDIDLIITEKKPSDIFIEQLNCKIIY